MRKITYLAVLEPDDGGYGVFFPDLPGCASYGKDLEEAPANAKEALELHVYGLEKDLEKLPEPSKHFDGKLCSGNYIAPITIFPDLVKNEMDNRRVKTNVTIPAWLKDLAEEAGVNYSKLLESSLIDYLSLNK